MRDSLIYSRKVDSMLVGNFVHYSQFPVTQSKGFLFKLAYCVSASEFNCAVYCWMNIYNPYCVNSI